MRIARIMILVMLVGAASIVARQLTLKSRHD